mgnify:FL=1
MEISVGVGMAAGSGVCVGAGAGLSVASGAGVSMAVSSVATVSSTSVLLSGVCKVLSVCCAQAQSNTVAKRMDNGHFFIL